MKAYSLLRYNNERRMFVVVILYSLAKNAIMSIDKSNVLKK